MCQFLLMTTFIAAQSVWDGGGDGTSWNDALNWDNDMLPTSDSIVEFNNDVVVTGTADLGPARITVKGQSTVTLDLDINIGNGMLDEHAIVVSSASSLIFGAGTARNFVLNPSSTKQGIAVFGGSDSVLVHITTEAIVQIPQALNGINMANTTSSFINDGTILIESEVKNGIKTSCNFTNNGSITMVNPITDGIVVGAGSFTNSANSNIIITKPADDCIDLSGESMFINMGMLSLVAQDSAGSGNNALSIGTDMIEATFLNEGSLDVDGGDKDNGRAVAVLEMGSFTNHGTATFTGGGANNRLHNKGISENGLNAVLDLQDGRININAGSLTNNGLIKTTYDGAGIFNSGTAVNNAFFDYANSNNFASGSNGTTEDNGISLNNNTQIINGGGSCMLDIAEATYEYFEGANSLGTTDETGALTLGTEVLSADSVAVTTTIPGVELIIKNVCTEAVITSSVFDLGNEVLAMKVYPSLVEEGQMMTIDLSAFPAKNIRLQIYNLSGQLVGEEMTFGAEEISISIDNFALGLHFLKMKIEGELVIGKFMKIK